MHSHPRIKYKCTYLKYTHSPAQMPHTHIEYSNVTHTHRIQSDTHLQCKCMYLEYTHRTYSVRDLYTCRMHSDTHVDYENVSQTSPKKHILCSHLSYTQGAAIAFYVCAWFYSQATNQAIKNIFWRRRPTACLSE